MDYFTAHPHSNELCNYVRSSFVVLFAQLKLPLAERDALGANKSSVVRVLVVKAVLLRLMSEREPKSFWYIECWRTCNFATPLLPVINHSILVLHLPLWSRSSPGGQGLLGAMMMLVWDTLCIGIWCTRLQNIINLIYFRIYAKFWLTNLHIMSCLTKTLITIHCYLLECKLNLIDNKNSAI